MENRNWNKKYEYIQSTTQVQKNANNVNHKVHTNNIQLVIKNSGIVVNIYRTSKIL